MWYFITAGLLITVWQINTCMLGVICVSFLYAIGSFLSQHKQPHLLYERIEQSMGIHVVKCVTYKNAAGAQVYIITILLGLQWNI